MRGFSAIGLINTKNEVNVGGVLRAATCYNSKMIAIQGKRYKAMSSDTTGAYRHIPLLHTQDILSLVPMDCVPVAVEIVSGARNIVDYIHPKSAFYIFGPEDGSIPNRVLKGCRDVIYIPTVRCMNLAATVNVVLYDRMAKQK